MIFATIADRYFRYVPAFLTADYMVRAGGVLYPAPRVVVDIITYCTIAHDTTAHAISFDTPDDQPLVKPVFLPEDLPSY